MKRIDIIVYINALLPPGSPLCPLITMAIFLSSNFFLHDFKISIEESLINCKSTSMQLLTYLLIDGQLTVDASLKTESSMDPVKVCVRTEPRLSSNHLAPLCTGITMDWQDWQDML